jgi:glycosyltransferase involved in cell wall biosynthesis
VPQYPVEGTLEFCRIKPRALYFSPALQRCAPQLVRETDVLHGHGLYVGTNLIFGRAARRELKPLVYHVHGMFEPYILQRSKWKKQLVHWLFENNNFRHVRLWRALTSKEADQIRACGLRQPIVIAPNGLNVADFPKPPLPVTLIDTPLVRSLRKNGPRALFLGRIHPKKGLELLLRAWAKIPHATRDWELVIAGPDEQGHLAEIRALTRSLALQNHVVFTGPVTGAAKNALLHSADLFVLPSFSEGFPMSLLEAMACEVPVVATHGCNFPEISRLQAGWECAPDVDALTITLQVALKSSASERRQRGLNGRRLVETGYTWPAIVKTLLSACADHC